MKLYFAPSACSLSPHIVLHESGLPFETERSNLRKKVTASGGNFLDINPKGMVPALVLDNGEILTEGPAIVQYIADLVPERGLAPPNGTLARARLHEWLNYISTELHKGYSPLFGPVNDEHLAAARKALEVRFAYVNQRLEGQTWLMGDTFSVADAYMFTVLSWAKWTKIDYSPYPNIQPYLDRVAARPAVQAALKAEGLS